ncbi:hypothetical protein [Aeromonas rivipollensis]|uniref:hypothetical protein n=1 Tax=Aeromonas rivipollensis TaxID=948519 RepID=UPI0038D04C62
MNQAVDTQPDQPLLSSPHSDPESTDTDTGLGLGGTVHLDVIDLAAPDDDY